MINLTQAGFVIVVGSLIVGCEAKDSKKSTMPAPVASYRVQEGFPSDVISRLQHHSDTNSGGVSGISTSSVQSIIKTTAIWTPGENPITVAFSGGSQSLRDAIASTARQWSSAGNVQFDFGPPGKYREWSPSDADYVAKIRISFDRKGYWSLVGADGINPSLTKPNEPSMNYQGFTSTLPSDWQGTVLHEFGHAIGFEHEHQNPEAKCDVDFRWYDDPGYVRTLDMYQSVVPDSSGRRPGIYSVLEGWPNQWKKEQIDFNLKTLPATTDFRFTKLDPKSIMMYSFQPWMFVNGAQDRCHTEENMTLSAVDRETTEQFYPTGKQELRIVTSDTKAALRIVARSEEISSAVRTVASQRLQTLNSIH